MSDKRQIVMSIQAAFEFMQHLRQGKPLTDELSISAREMTLDKLVLIGQRAGYTFSIAELRQAHHLDWNMRARFYTYHEH